MFILIEGCLLLGGMSVVSCCNRESRGFTVTQECLIKAYENLSPQAQKKLVELLLNTRGVTRKIEKVLQQAINDPKLVKTYVGGADFVIEAIKKGLREDKGFAISVHDALDDEKAALYGLKYDKHMGTIQYTKPALRKSILHK
jgi:hypothetical protein